jgi:hypothetical protein
VDEILRRGPGGVGRSHSLVRISVEGPRYAVTVGLRERPDIHASASIDNDRPIAFLPLQVGVCSAISEIAPKTGERD